MTYDQVTFLWITGLVFVATEKDNTLDLKIGNAQTFYHLSGDSAVANGWVGAVKHRMKRNSTWRKDKKSSSINIPKGRQLISLLVCFFPSSFWNWMWNVMVNGRLRGNVPCVWITTHAHGIRGESASGSWCHTAHPALQTLRNLCLSGESEHRVKVSCDSEILIGQRLLTALHQLFLLSLLAIESLSCHF